LKIFHNDRFRGRFTDLALACSRSDSADGKNHIDSGDHIKVINYILNHTDDTRAKKVLTAPNKFGKTPLLIACENGLKEIVKLIIDKMNAKILAMRLPQHFSMITSEDVLLICIVLLLLFVFCCLFRWWKGTT